MTSLFALLSLPSTSNGLTSINSPPTALEVDDGSGSRKVARLTTGSDSASASRLKAKPPSAQKPEGPIQIEIVGEYRSKPPAVDKQLSMLRRSIKITFAYDVGLQEELPATYEGIYNACRSVVTISNRGEQLYNILKTELVDSIKAIAMWLGMSDKKDTAWIGTFNRTFNWLEERTARLQSLLTYLDQVYVVHTQNVLSVRDLAYNLITEWIFGSAQVIDKLQNGVKSWLDTERRTRLPHPDRAAIPALIQHLYRHHQYSSFGVQYVELTHTFYKQESAAKAEALKADPKAFFEQAAARIKEEADRSKAVLPVAAWSAVREVTENALWDGRTEWLASSTLASYMDNKDITSLSSMYTLFSRVGSVKALCAAFGAHIRTTVSNIVKDMVRDDDMVQRLLDFKDLADQISTTAFVCEKPEINTSTSASTSAFTSPPTPAAPAASTSKLPPLAPDQQFLYAITDAFSTGFKARRAKPAEMIAKHVDKAMRKGQGSASDAAFRARLDKVLALYRFTDDKDVFRTFYHRSLAKRLLLEKSASDDFERGVLKKLKEDYDPEFGMGEDMFKNLALSRDSMREYHSKLEEDSPGRKLTAMVLQRSAWPFTAQKQTVDLPPNMQAELTKYADYYKSRHVGHVLSWDHSLGTATLKARFNTSVKELSVSLYQTLVLLLFNDVLEIPFPDIKEQTNMDDGELRRTLQSLACGKKKVLKKIPVGKDVNDTDVFRFNADFEDPFAKIHINTIQAKVSLEESKRTNASIEDDRKHYLDAAIVRIMKARKEMTYEQLKAATIDAVKSHFVPQVDTIKRRIDSLVESEYLERSPEDRNMYMYIA